MKNYLDFLKKLNFPSRSEINPPKAIITAPNQMKTICGL